MKKEFQNSRGFTLIELLVVIAIIGLLSSVVLASLNSAKLKANDAKRYSDLHALFTAIELYANDHNGQYPATQGNGGTVADSLPVLVPTYIASLPTDPSPASRNAQTTTWYRYYAGTGGFTLLTYPESGSHANSWCRLSDGADPATWSVVFPQCGP